jgi:hypothetical protein
MKNKEVVNVKLDPMRETADINEKNNVWPLSNTTPSSFQLFKSRQGEGRGARGSATGAENLIQREAKKEGKILSPIW